MCAERTFEIDYLKKTSEIINKYGEQWLSDSINPLDLNTEMELLTNLNGLSRLIENVMRIAIARARIHLLAPSGLSSRR